MFQLIIVLFTIPVHLTFAAEIFPLHSKVKNIIPFEDNGTTYRLPNNTKPEYYEVNIRTWIHDGIDNFTGFVKIGIIALETTNSITLHHRLLTIQHVQVSSDDGIPIAIGEPTYDERFEFFTIPIAENNLTSGRRYIVEITYFGAMHYLSGFFYSYYVNDSGDIVWFGSTQFEATEARRAFLCYDEPSLKANFTIRITHDPSYSAISNMPVASLVQQPDGSVTTAFQETPPISTYLVAFHISDFSYVSSNTSSIPQRVYIRPNALNQTNLGLAYGEYLLDAFSKYIGVEYSLPKMDQVGKPAYGGSFENWGLLSHSEYYFLFDKNIHLAGRQIDAIITISHELAHQWFGSYVTPSWWTYLWMKEGFGTLLQYIGVDLVHPDWNMTDFFLVSVIHAVFQSDASEFTRPMTYYVESPYDIDSQYNFVAYGKAASVLRMFMYAFGENTFMEGVADYLNSKYTSDKIYNFSMIDFVIIRSAYSDATEEDLFDALEMPVSLDPENVIPPNADVATIMASWTRQAGFPIITIARNYADSPNEVTVSQKRYYSSLVETSENTTWWIPYSIATPTNSGYQNTRAEAWIPQNISSMTITVDSLQPDEYLLLNKRAAGYYRVLYDERNYKLLSDAIVKNMSEFHVTNRAQLLNDAYEYVGRGYISYETVMDLLRILEHEDEYITWNAAQYILGSVTNNFFGHQSYALWEDFNRNLIEYSYDTLGIEDIPEEPIQRKFLREFTIDWACRVRSVHCRSDATRRLRQLITNGTEFHQNVRHVLYCAGLWSGNSNDFNFVWNRLLESEDISERYIYINSLSCSMSRQLLTEYLRSSLNSTNSRNIEYRENEQIYVFLAVCNNGHFGFEIALEFLIENAVEAFYTYGSYVVTNLGIAAIRPDLTQKYRFFLSILYENNLIQQDIIDNVEYIFAEQNKWLETNGEIVNRWLLLN